MSPQSETTNEAPPRHHRQRGCSTTVSMLAWSRPDLRGLCPPWRGSGIPGSRPLRRTLPSRPGSSAKAFACLGQRL